MADIPPDLMQALLANYMQNQNSGLQTEADIYGRLGPEGLRNYTNLGSLDKRSALAAQQSEQGQAAVAQQLAQMQKYAEPHSPQYTNLAASILGGLGDVTRGVMGGIGAHQLRAKQQAIADQGAAAQTGILGQQDQGHFDYATARYQALQDALLRQRQAQQMPGMQQNQGLSLGLPGLQLDPNMFGG